MGIIYKVLGQANPTTNTVVTLYTTPALTNTVCSTLSVCATSGSSTTVNVAVQPAAASLANQHFILYQTPVNAYNPLFLTLGVSLAASDIVTVSSANGNVAFCLFGSEIS